MDPLNIPFQTIDWTSIPAVRHPGESGDAWWKTLQLGGLRIRIVEYSPGYLADHWCARGHIVHCLEGTFTSELKDGASFILTKGMTYVVSDDMSLHRSAASGGATLLIVDGGFLASKGNGE